MSNTGRVPADAVKYFLLIIGSLFSLLVQGQDIHYSQYYNAPLTINPSYTGSFDGDYRVGANYRQQWRSVTVPYRTLSAFADISLLSRHHKSSFPSFGLNMIRDKAGDGNLSVTKLFGSFAYHIAFNHRRDQILTLGIQGGYVQKSLDWQFLYFNSQWNEQQFDQNLPSEENNSTAKIGYPDFSVGANFSNVVNRHTNYYAGIAVYHMARSQESFYGMDNQPGLRPVLNGGLNFTVGQALQLHPSFEYMNQKKASELVLGSLMSYDLGENSGNGFDKLYAGVFYRVKDALIPVIGYGYGNWKLTINYDINMSELTPFSNGRGAWEISLIYTGLYNKLARTIIMPCPRF